MEHQISDSKHDLGDEVSPVGHEEHLPFKKETRKHFQNVLQVELLQYNSTHVVCELISDGNILEVVLFDEVKGLGNCEVVGVSEILVVVMMVHFLLLEDLGEDGHLRFA